MIQLVAYQPDIALNLGNMIRTSACFGISIAVIEPCGFPFSIKALRRSAMDYADMVEIEHYLDWQSFCQTGSRRVLLSSKASTPYHEFTFQKGDSLIMGRESAGVPKEVEASCDASLTIPMPGGGRSLNVSNAAAIVAAEALRQFSVL